MALAARVRVMGAELGPRFEQVQLLRAGARFTMYEGRDSATNRRVVVKTAGATSAPWLYDVLQNEAVLLAAIGPHPHIVTLYEQIALDDGRPALVLERCVDRLADGVRADEPMPLRDAVAVGIKLAGALETAHRSGVLHCDVRADNVLVSEWNEPVLSGFDEAVRLDSAARPPLHVLTPHTAPEVLEGDAPGRASDVYGLAATLYELVAGRAAFQAYAGESPARAIVRVLSHPVRPIIGPHIPIEISDLLTWGLAPDPDARPPSPAWLAEELGRVEQREGWPRTRMIFR